MKLAKHKHLDGKSTRWFADYDTAAFNGRYRTARMALVDLVAILQSSSPYNRTINFDLNLAELFNQFEQSMVVACVILRDELMWQVPMLSNDTNSPCP